MYNDDYSRYNLDYDLHVLDPKNKDTQDFQAKDCMYDAIQKIDGFITAQIRANQMLRQDNMKLQQEVQQLRQLIMMRRLCQDSE